MSVTQATAPQSLQQAPTAGGWPHVAPAGPHRSDPAYQHLAPLLVEFAAVGSDGPRRAVLRDALVVGFLPVVAHIARRYSGRGEPVEDLVQAATIGLLNALDRFVPPPVAVDTVGAFLGYAVPTATGEVRRHFRDRTWTMTVPRRLKDLQAPIREAVGSLTRELRRAPRPSEIAAHLDISAAEVIEGLHAGHAHTPHSIDTPFPGTDASFADTLGRLDALLDRVEYRDTLRVAFGELPERDRTMLVLRFFDDRTQSQIGEQLGISQMHVSRLLSRSLATLRQRLGAD